MSQATTNSLGTPGLTPLTLTRKEVRDLLTSNDHSLNDAEVQKHVHYNYFSSAELSQALSSTSLIPEVIDIICKYVALVDWSTPEATHVHQGKVDFVDSNDSIRFPDQSISATPIKYAILHNNNKNLMSGVYRANIYINDPISINQQDISDGLQDKFIFRYAFKLDRFYTAGNIMTCFSVGIATEDFHQDLIQDDNVENFLGGDINCNSWTWNVNSIKRIWFACGGKQKVMGTRGTNWELVEHSNDKYRLDFADEKDSLILFEINLKESHIKVYGNNMQTTVFDWNKPLNGQEAKFVAKLKERKEFKVGMRIFYTASPTPADHSEAVRLAAGLVQVAL